MAAWTGSDRRDRRAAGRQQPGRLWTKPSRQALPTSSSRPTPEQQRGAFYGFQNLSDENLKDEPAPRPAAIARGRYSENRIEPVKKGGAAIQIVIACIRVSHVSKKEDNTELDFAFEAVIEPSIRTQLGRAARQIVNVLEASWPHLSHRSACK